MIKWLINTAGIILVAKLVPGIGLAGYKTAVIAALIIGLINAFIKPMIIIITLPINILSLGVFTLFINTFVFYAASRLVRGFVIDGFWSAFIGALCLSVISFLLNMFTGPLKNIEVRTGYNRTDAGPARRNAIDAEVVPPKGGDGKEKKLLG